MHATTSRLTLHSHHTRSYKSAYNIEYNVHHKRPHLVHQTYTGLRVLWTDLRILWVTVTQ